MKTISLLIFSFFFFAGVAGFSQTEVTLINGETLSGIVVSDIETINKNGLSIQIGEQERTLTAKEIAGIRSEKGRMFTAYILEVDIKNLATSQLDENKEPEFVTDTVLLERIVSGPISLLQFVDKNEKEHFFIQQGAENPEELIFTKYLLYNEQGLEVRRKENSRYKVQLSEIFESCSAVFPLINDAEYKWKNLSEIVVVGNTACKEVALDELIIAPVPTDKVELEVSAGVGIGHVHLYGINYKFDLELLETTLKPGYSGSLAATYYPAAMKGRFGFQTELSIFNLKQDKYYEDITSPSITRKGNMSIDYRYLSLSLILRKIMAGKNKPFWQVGYSYGYIYGGGNPLEKETFFYGTTTISEDEEGYVLQTSENAVILGAGIMPGRFILKASGRISTGSTLLVGQGSFHLLGHLTVGYRL